MILYFIALFVLIVGIIFVIIDRESFIAAFGTVVGGAAVLIMSFIIISSQSYLAREANIERYKETKATLEYQIANKCYTGNLLAEFNTKIINDKIYNKSPWFNWFIGDYVEEFKPIEFAEVEK
jgi:membrane-bound ClpP family serine protease